MTFDEQLREKIKNIHIDTSVDLIRRNSIYGEILMLHRELTNEERDVYVLAKMEGR